MFLHGSFMLRVSVLRRMLFSPSGGSAHGSIKQSSNAPRFQDAGELWLVAHD